MASAMVQVNVRIPPILHEQLRREVEDNGVTVTAVVTAALVAYLQGRATREEA